MEFLAALISIVVINLVLSGDNAVIIAMASRNLPVRQQKLAIFWGSAGAIGLRVILTTGAVILLKVPLLKAIGGALLVWIAVKLLKKEEREKDACKEASCLLDAIKTIIIADFLMSLDNVLAVAGASRGNVLLLIIGLAMSIPIIIYGSRIIVFLMKKSPLIIHVGAGILGWTAGEMIAGDQQVEAYLQIAMPILDLLLPILLTLFVVVFGYWLNLRQKKKLRET